MGLAKHWQHEQDELTDFVDALIMGHLNDPEDFDYAHRYDSVPREINSRMVRDIRTGRFIAKVEGTDYHWNDDTIVFADDGGWHKPMVITATAGKAVL